MLAEKFRCRGAAAAVAVCLSGGGCASDSPPPFEFFDACDPNAVPDTACYADKRDPGSAHIELATEIALGFIDAHPPAEQEWNWEEGVLMYALTELYRVTGDARLRDYYRAWIDFHIGEGYEILLSDSCPPALAALALYVETGDEAYAEVVREVMRYLREDALRTEQGGISHFGELGIVSLWVDSLFMFGMVLNRWGELEDALALDEMGEQLAIFGDQLQATSGWFVHADDWPLETDDDIYWARGNSWVTVAATDYLRARVLRYEDDAVARSLLNRQIAAVLGAQDASGGWWTVLNRPGEIYLETSATALFGYGLARAYRYGLVDDGVIDHLVGAHEFAVGAVVRDEAGRPVVTGISGPTMAGTFDDYAGVALRDDLSYGVGAVILLLTELSGLPQIPPPSRLQRR